MMSKFKRLSLSESAEAFPLLNAEAKQALKGGCDHCSEWEELLHATQDWNEFYSDMNAARKNVEFEVKVFHDILACEMLTGGMTKGTAYEGVDPKFEADYKAWIENMVKNGVDERIGEFNGFADRWQGYSGNYDSNFEPELIKKYY